MLYKIMLRNFTHHVKFYLLQFEKFLALFRAREIYPVVLEDSCFAVKDGLFKFCGGGQDGDWKKWASFRDTLILKVFWKYLLKPILRAHCIWSTLKRNERDKVAEFTSPFQLHHLVVCNKYEGASLNWNWPTLAFSVLVSICLWINLPYLQSLSWNMVHT